MEQKYKWFRILLDDYSVPPITTADKEYYGTLDDVKGLIESFKNDERHRDSSKDTIEAFEKFVGGDKHATHNIAYQEVPILTPIKVIYETEQEIKDFEWEHLNAWHFVYDMKLSSAKVLHYWIKDQKHYRRIIKAQIIGLCYKDTVDNWTDPHDMFWGFPGMLVRDGKILYNRLACIEKNFDSFDDLQDDYENYLKNSDVDFERFCDDIFGDG